MYKEYIKEFGLRIFLIVGFTRILRRFKLKRFIQKYENFKYESIINWLDKSYGKEVDKIAKEKSERRKIKKNDIIWIFWWQGEETMPPIVRSCYKSVLKNAEDHPVILITEKNVKDYIHLPQFIYDKIKTKKMTLTHFSDILRENLLYDYGGIWMDATIYMTAPFSNEMYNYEYYSIKGAFYEWKWTGFFQASGKGNLFAKSVSHLFNCYWKEHDCLISYLLIDCFLEVAHRHSSDIDRMVESLPQKDSSVFLLNDYFLDRPYDECEMQKICGKSNLHKLSYKYEHADHVNGEITFWKHIMMEENE